MPGLGDDTELVQLVRQPGDGVDRVAHHRRGHPALLDDAVDRQAGADAADVDVGQPDGTAAEHHPPARGGVGDAVDEPVRAPALLAVVDDLDARQHEVGRPDHVDRVHGRAGQRLAEHEGELDLDERIVHPAARDDTTFEHEPVVEHRAVVGFGGARQRAHRLGREADLVALDDAPSGDLARSHRAWRCGRRRRRRRRGRSGDRRDRGVVELSRVQCGGGLGDEIVGQHRRRSNTPSIWA